MKIKTRNGIKRVDFLEPFQRKVRENTFDISGAVEISQEVSQDRFAKFPYAFITHYFGLDYNYSNNRQHIIFGIIDRMPFTSITQTTGQIVPKLKLMPAYKYYNYGTWYGIKLRYKLNDRLSFASFIKSYCTNT